MFGNSDRSQSRAARKRTVHEREEARLGRERRRQDQGEGAGAADHRGERSPAPQPADARTPAPGSPPSGRRERPIAEILARVGALIGAVLLVALALLLIALFQPGHGRGEGKVIVEIPAGSSASRIGSILAGKGVVSSALLFDIRAWLEGKRGELHSGRFVMSRDMSYAAALDALSKPPPGPIVVKVLVPEGFRRDQIAAVARSRELTGSYLEASRRSSLLDPASYGAPAGTPNLEGFLFPATYELLAGAPAGRLVGEQLAAFKQRFGQPQIRRARALGLTPYQLLIVASMIEGEAQLPRDRPLVAAVIYNRLRRDMALGIDATIRYALNDYTHPLTAAQLAIDSPYNTRIHRGLPPTPIGNPGMAAIEAAGHPAHVPYLYYVAGADGCGELVFSTSYARFLQDAAAYQEAIRDNGGRVPTCHR